MSSPRAAEALTLVQGAEWYSIDQFYQALYRPDLVQEKMSGDPRGLVRGAAARLDLEKVIASGKAPSVAVASPRDGARVNSRTIDAVIDVLPGAAGAGRIEWRVNGVTVGIDQPQPGNQSFRLTRTLALDEGDNEIEVAAYNRENLVASVPARTTVTASVGGASARSRLFLLAVGLNEYEEADIRLKYAVPDAIAISEAVRKAAAGLFESVNLTVVRDADVRQVRLDEIFRKLSAEIQPSDLFVFFIAGHGKTIDGRYYFIPQNFRSDGLASVLKQGISQEQWQRWFAAIPARRSVLLFDTCESGSLTDDTSQTRALERGAANDRLVRATGRTVLTATSDKADAFEGYRGHGLFTYNILEALGAADSDLNGTIELSELAAYVHAQVTLLSEKVFNRRQVPQVRMTGNYTLGRSTRIVADATSDILISRAPTHMVGEAELLVLPSPDSRRVRKLPAKTPVTAVRSEAGWALIARDGRPVGYVATRDLEPLR
ncbi:MAG: caspase family protein [Pseudorhodoplanes sp.]